MNTKLDAAALAKLSQRSAKELHKQALADELPVVVAENFLTFSANSEFDYSDALAIEVSRQLSDDGGLCMKAAAKLVGNIVADLTDENSDQWIAIVRNRNPWPAGESRGSWPVTDFGDAEFWSSAHFAGSLQSVTDSISQMVASDRDDRASSEPARIFMTNVSTADRHLRKRAASLGIALD